MERKVGRGGEGRGIKVEEWNGNGMEWDGMGWKNVGMGSEGMGGDGSETEI